MPVPHHLERDPAIIGPLGGLALSQVRSSSPMHVVRAVRWWRDLARLGVRLPLFVVHDLGLLYGAPHEQIELAPRPGVEGAVARIGRLVELVAQYREVIAEIAKSQAATRARTMKLGDDL